MVNSEPFDVLAYLQEELPGFKFEKHDPTSFGGVMILKAQTTLRLGVQGELDTVLMPVPQLSRYRKEWADQLIEVARKHASKETGLDKVWDERERQLKAQFADERANIQREAEARIHREVGKAYLVGKAAGEAERGEHRDA